MMCGGKWTPKSCRRWNADTGDWDLVTEALRRPREYHISWTPADGTVTYLMGGSWSGILRTSSEMLQHDKNKVSKSFSMKHNTL